MSKKARQVARQQLVFCMLCELADVILDCQTRVVDQHVPTKKFGRSCRRIYRLIRKANKGKVSLEQVKRGLVKAQKLQSSLSLADSVEEG